MSYVEPDEIGVRQLYQTGLLASMLSYVGLVGLVALSLAVGTGKAGSAFGAMLAASIFTIVPALAIAILITAPLGTVIAKSLIRLSLPGAWLGALTGFAVAVFLMGAGVLVLAEAREAPDAGTVLFIALLLTVCAGSGALAQRIVLEPHPYWLR